MQRKAKSARALAFSGVLVTVVAVLLGGGQTTAQAGPPGDAVLDWNLNALDALFNPTRRRPTPPTRPGAGQTPPVAAQHMAMVQGAVYDAVNMIDRGHEPYLDGLRGRRGAPRSRRRWRRRRTTCSSALESRPFRRCPRRRRRGSTTPTRRRSRRSRTASARTPGSRREPRPQRRCSRSGRRRPLRAVLVHVPRGPGEWRPANSLTCIIPPTPGTSDPFAWVAKVKPFMLKSTSQFRTNGPQKLKSRAYTKEYNEVKRLGGNGTRRRGADAGAAGRRAVLHPEPRADVQPGAPHDRAGRGAVDRRGGSSLRDGERGASRTPPSTAGTTRRSGATGVRSRRSGSATRRPTDKTVGDPEWTSFIGTPPYPDMSSATTASRARS